MGLTARERKNLVIFDIEGDLTLTTIEAVSLHRAVKEMLEKGKRRFLINFAEVPFVDSTGVGELLAGYVSIQNVGGLLKMEKINQKIRLILDITGISKLFEIFEDEDEAIKSFAQLYP
jgi:anti-sigma B factor antagonist